MTAIVPGGLPKIAPVQPQSIPDLLKWEKRWVAWWPGPVKPTGKFDKFPVHPWTGRKINPLDPNNWLTFEEAMDAQRRDMAKGIGIALSDRHPINVSGVDYILTAVDLDHCVNRMSECEALWNELAKPYVEVSPSGNGLRILGLCSSPLKGGDAGNGNELYSSGRFMTITGVNARGEIKDISASLMDVERRWFSSRIVAQSGTLKSTAPIIPETVVNVGAVLSMLDTVSSDIPYHDWRNISWSVASTGWNCAPQILHGWSRRTPLRYEPKALDNLIDDFDPNRGITLGTLVHHARQNGWAGPVPTQLHSSLPVQPPLPVALPTTSSPPPASAPPLPPLPLLMTAQQLRQVPIPPYVVRNVLPALGLASIYGESGSGKSFLALHLAHAIALGSTDWFGFHVHQKPVVYVALEGVGGIGKRATALELHSKQNFPDSLRFWCRDIHLMTGESIDLLASEIVSTVGKGAIVIIDTLNQASPGADENGPQDMGKIIANSKRLAAAVDGLVILVHHAGKNRALGMRGHTSLYAAMDTVIEVATVEGKHKTWSITKAKDDSSDVACDFDLVPYTTGHDAFGPITSCAVQQTVHIKAPNKRRITGKHQKAAIYELRRILPSQGQHLEYKAALQHVAAVVRTTKGKENDRAKEAVDALIRDGHIQLDEEGVSIA